MTEKNKAQVTLSPKPKTPALIKGAVVALAVTGSAGCEVSGEAQKGSQWAPDYGLDRDMNVVPPMVPPEDAGSKNDAAVSPMPPPMFLPEDLGIPPMVPPDAEVLDAEVLPPMAPPRPDMGVETDLGAEPPMFMPPDEGVPADDMGAPADMGAADAAIEEERDMEQPPMPPPMPPPPMVPPDRRN